MENKPAVVDEIDEESEVEADEEPVRAGASNIALTITIISLVLWFGFQAFQLVRERSNLRLVKGNQETAMQESEKIQSQFQALIKKTADLAGQGHAGAKMVMDELAKRGVGVAPSETTGEKPEPQGQTRPPAPPSQK